jgi:hypothetical protein
VFSREGAKVVFCSRSDEEGLALAGIPSRHVLHVYN